MKKCCKKKLEEFANDLYPILEWHTRMDCVADFKCAEIVRKKYAPDSICWENLKEDE